MVVHRNDMEIDVFFPLMLISFDYFLFYE